MQHDLQMIENPGPDSLSTTCLFVSRKPFSRAFAIAHPPRITGQKIRYGADFRKGPGLMMQLQISVERSLQFEKTERETEPASKAVRANLREYARHIPRRLPILRPRVNSPSHREHFRMEPIKPGDLVGFQLRLGHVAQRQPAKGEVQVMFLWIIQLPHERTFPWQSSCQPERKAGRQRKFNGFQNNQSVHSLIPGGVSLRVQCECTSQMHEPFVTGAAFLRARPPGFLVTFRRGADPSNRIETWIYNPHVAPCLRHQVVSSCQRGSDRKPERDPTADRSRLRPCRT